MLTPGRLVGTVDNGSTTVSASHTALYCMQSILSWVGPNQETASSYIISLQTVTTGKLIYSISTHTHTHTRLTALFPRSTRVSRYEKGKTNLDFTEPRNSEWQWHQLGHMQVCTSLQTDNHASTPPLSFYRPDALPAAQATASKH